MVEGERAVEQVIDNGVVEVENLFFDKSQQLWNSSFWSEKAEWFSSALVDTDSFSEVTDTDNPQGILALCRIPQEADLQNFAEKEGILVATDRIQDPGNLGTMVRTAAWFGASGLLLGKGTVDLFNPKVVRSTAGTTGTLPFVNVDLKSTLSLFEESGWQVLMLDSSKNAENIRTVDSLAKIILVIGNEANGIAPALLKNPVRRKIEIPTPAKQQQVESLNASIALSIALYALTG